MPQNPDPEIDIPEYISVETGPKDLLCFSAGYAARHAALMSLLPECWALLQGGILVST